MESATPINNQPSGSYVFEDPGTELGDTSANQTQAPFANTSSFNGSLYKMPKDGGSPGQQVQI